MKVLPWGLWTLAWLWSLVQELMLVKLHFAGSRRCCLNINTTQKKAISQMWGQRLRKAGCPSCEARCWSCPHACGPVLMLWPQEQPRGKGACPGPHPHTHPWLFFPWVTHLLRPPRNWLPITLRVGFQFLSGRTLFKQKVTLNSHESNSQ